MPVETNFYIGRTWCPNKDLIRIDSVQRANGVMAVKGTYNLGSADSATLTLTIGNTKRGVGVLDPMQTVVISKGSGSFELSHPHVIPGWPNVYMHSFDHSPLAAVYFGNEQESAQERDAKLNLTNWPHRKTN